jgi:hypothetical protein
VLCISRSWISVGILLTTLCVCAGDDIIVLGDQTVEIIGRILRSRERLKTACYTHFAIASSQETEASNKTKQLFSSERLLMISVAARLSCKYTSNFSSF